VQVAGPAALADAFEASFGDEVVEDGEAGDAV
jgi:hypothetical protein